jgi:GcrA cell cycle regulator
MTAAHNTANNSANNTWTDERIEGLKRGFAAGLSCRQIADDIGVSRNAVIGKLSRLGLTGAARDETPRLGRKPAPGQPAPRRQQQLLATVYEAPSEAAPVHSAEPCSLLELSAQRCRWPISAPDADDVRFCGNTPLDGLPYCAGHTRLAYRPGSRLRVARG